MELIPEINAKHPEEMENLRDTFDKCEVLFWTGSRPEDDRMVNPVRGASKRTGMMVYAVHIPNYPINQNNDAVPGLINIIHKMNSAFEPRVINMHCLYGGLEEMKRNLRVVLESIPEELILTIENMNRKKANLRGTETIPAFLEGLEVYKNFGICLDTSHLPIINERKHSLSLAEFIDKSGNGLRHLHFSDVVKSAEGYPGHQPIGTGIIDWKIIKQKLEEVDYTGKATIEYLKEHKNRVGEALRYWENL